MGRASERRFSPLTGATSRVLGCTAVVLATDTQPNALFHVLAGSRAVTRV